MNPIIIELSLTLIFSTISIIILAETTHIIKLSIIIICLSTALLPLFMLPRGIIAQTGYLPSSYNIILNILFWILFVNSWLILPVVQ